MCNNQCWYRCPMSLADISEDAEIVLQRKLLFPAAMFAIQAFYFPSSPLTSKINHAAVIAGSINDNRPPLLPVIVLRNLPILNYITCQRHSQHYLLMSV